MTSCSLCSPRLEPILAEGEYWRLILNWNQDLLGKCFLVARRHVESILQLTVDEWTELHTQLQQATERLVTAFHPVHFNYTFLQNQDRHVHMHIMPRYPAPVRFNGETFEDLTYPGHYAVPAKQRLLTAEQLASLARHLGDRVSESNRDGSGGL